MMERMYRMTAFGGALLALGVLTACGSGDTAAPEAPAPVVSAPSSQESSSAAATSTPPPSSTSADGAAPSAIPAPSVNAVPPVGPGGPSASTGAGAAPPRATGAAPAPAAPSDKSTLVYTARFCTALAPLATFKQQNETPNLAGVTNGQEAKALAIRLLNDGVTIAQNSVNAVTALGPAPDAAAATGVNGLLASLRQSISVGKALVPQAQAVDPNNPMALLALASQARAQASTFESTGLGALRTSTGTAMSAALRTVPECAPLGI